MRISGGQLKGRKTASQKAFSKKNEGDELRPTSAKVREAVFDIPRDAVDHASFLDLYAGTGTVGLEALSRGSDRTYFVEDSRLRACLLRDTLAKIGLADRATVYQEQALDFMRRASRSGLRFDIIFADPPYASEDMQKIVALIDEHGLLKEGGRLIIEHSSRTALPDDAPTLRLVKNYKYGDTMLTLYRKEP